MTVMLLCFFDSVDVMHLLVLFFCFQAEDGIRDLVRSRGLGDVYKRQSMYRMVRATSGRAWGELREHGAVSCRRPALLAWRCLLYTSDAADERSSVDLGGRRIINKKNN